MGFNPAVEDEGRRIRSAPISGGLWERDRLRGRIDGLITNAFEDGAVVSPREVRTRALTNCFGVSMP